MKRSATAQLDSLLTGLEQLVLDDNAAPLVQDTEQVRQVIARTMKRPAQPKKSSLLIEKLSLLRELGTRRPDLRPKLGLAYQGTSRPTAQEVDALIEAMVNAGEIKRDK